jgi:DNA-binding NtrC family response regulator
VEKEDLKDLEAALERQYLTQLFLRSKGDLKSMMAKLQVKRTWLYKWFRKLGLDIEDLRRRLKEG